MCVRVYLSKSIIGVSILRAFCIVLPYHSMRIVRMKEITLMWFIRGLFCRYLTRENKKNPGLEREKIGIIK